MLYGSAVPVTRKVCRYLEKIPALKERVTEGHRVDLIQHSGGDYMVINAARVSFDEDNVKGEDSRYYLDDQSITNDGIRLIDYMANHNHWTPFAHNHVTFRLTMPIYVANQLKRHQIGYALNEVSRRYCKKPPEYPTIVWRRENPKVKQGSAGEFDVVNQETLTREYMEFLEEADRLYHRWLKNGVAGEQARAILPMAMMTSFYWTGSLPAFSHMCGLRIESHAQKEIRLLATEISMHMSKIYPHSWAALARSEGFPTMGILDDHVDVQFILDNMKKRKSERRGIDTLNAILDEK